MFQNRISYGYYFNDYSMGQSPILSDEQFSAYEAKARTFLKSICTGKIPENTERMDSCVMKTTKIELTRVTASTGKWLTNGETYSKEIYLGVNDMLENWREITDEEYDEILKQQQTETPNTKE